jgi:hypothetical protein
LEIEGGPSEEYEQANAAWDNLVAATLQAIRDRDEAESLWQSGRRSEAMAILMKNPNVGIEYRVIYKNERIAHGSYFGQEAADFLDGISIVVGLGLLSPVTQAGSRKPVPLPSDLEDRVADRVNNPATDCGELMKKIINEAAARKGKAHSNDPLTIFQRVQREGGFHLRIQKNSGEAPVTMSGKRIVYIKQVFESDDPRVINHVQNAYANVALNEIMHHAASGGSVYTDRILAQALFKVMTPAEQLANPLPQSSNEKLNGRYFHNFLTARCPPS